MINIKQENETKKLDQKEKLSCAFTGHRELRDDFSEEKLDEAIEECLRSGIRYFYCGMARGFDIFAAKKLLEKKVKYPDIKLIACIPFNGQSKGSNDGQKKLYDEILSHADEAKILNPFYTRGSMLDRNKYMVNHADTLIAYCYKDTGGTAFTIGYFKERKPNGKILYV